MEPTIRNFLYNGGPALRLPARREAFATLREWLDAIAGELALEGKSRKQLLIAADEIFTNIASYGYPAGEGTAAVSVAFDTETTELALTFTDSGVPYNPLEAPPPEIGRPPAERAAGGLGIFLVKKLMDSVSYRREDGRNILVLKKRLLRKNPE